MTIQPDSEEMKLVSEKPLIGEGKPVLRMLATHDRKRMCLVLSQDGFRTELVFAGVNNSLLNSEECKAYFDRIHTEDQFLQISEQLRESLADLINNK
jgi:hypothetical protein